MGTLVTVMLFFRAEQSAPSPRCSSLNGGGNFYLEALRVAGTALLAGLLWRVTVVRAVPPVQLVLLCLSEATQVVRASKL
eukprot:376768-Amphidinium_carterae.5